MDLTVLVLGSRRLAPKPLPTKSGKESAPSDQRPILYPSPSMALTECPECASRVSDRAASCPHCGYPLSLREERAHAFDHRAMMAFPRANVWLALVLVVAFGALVFAGVANGFGLRSVSPVESSAHPEPSASTRSEPPKTERPALPSGISCESQIGDFCLGNESSESDGVLTYLTGIIVNTGNKRYSYVQLSFNFTDGNGTIVEPALANVANLGPGESWKWKVPMPSDRSAAGVTGLQVRGF